MNYLTTPFTDWDISEELSRHIVSRYLPPSVETGFFSGETTLTDLYEGKEPKRIALELEQGGVFTYPGRLEGHRLPVYPWPSWSLSYSEPEHPKLRKMHEEHKQLSEMFVELWDLLTVEGLGSQQSLAKLAEIMAKLNDFLERHHELEETELMPLLDPSEAEAEELEERIAHEHRLEEDWNEYANRIMDQLDLAPEDPPEDLLTQVELVMRYLCWELWHHSALEEHGFLSVIPDQTG